jgi:hypothetical protein
MRRFLLASAFVALVGVAQLGPLVHLVLVPHVTCAAHGELVHGSAEAAPASPVDDDVAFAPGASKDHHEHCVTLNAQRSALLKVSARAAVGAVHTQLLAGCERVAAFCLGVLARAPKASPPV